MTEESSDEKLKNRRPLATRSAGWAKSLAKGLAAIGLTPNAISVIGILFAGLGAYCMINAWSFPGADWTRWLWLGGAICIQLRLLANMLDGLVAVEEGKSSATGALYNEFPDRIEDALLLVAAGYACGMPELGYGATILAFGTAYIRALGGSLGLSQDFVGPMAKQHRMFVLTVGALLQFAVTELPYPMFAALGVIIVGSALTCAIRLYRIANLLRAKETGK